MMATPNFRALSERERGRGRKRDQRRARRRSPPLATISKEQRLVMTKKPLSGSAPARQQRPISLSSALWRPTSSRTPKTRRRGRTMRRACDGAGQRVERLARSRSASAARIAGGATGRAGDCAGEPSRQLSEVLDAAQAAARASAIARLRARCAFSRSPDSVTSSRRPPSTASISTPRTSSATLEDSLGEQRSR